MNKMLKAMVTRKSKTVRNALIIAAVLFAGWCLLMLPASIAGAVLIYGTVLTLVIKAKTKSMKAAFLFVGIILFTFNNAAFDVLLKLAIVLFVFYVARKQNVQPDEEGDNE